MYSSLLACDFLLSLLLTKHALHSASRSYKSIVMCHVLSTVPDFSAREGIRILMDQSNESGLFVPPLAAVSHDTTQMKESGLMMKLPAKYILLAFWFWKILSQFTLSLPSKG